MGSDRSSEVTVSGGSTVQNTGNTNMFLKFMMSKTKLTILEEGIVQDYK